MSATASVTITTPSESAIERNSVKTQGLKTWAKVQDHLIEELIQENNEGHLYTMARVVSLQGQQTPHQQPITNDIDLVIQLFVFHSVFSSWIFSLKYYLII